MNVQWVYSYFLNLKHEENHVSVLIRCEGCGNSLASFWKLVHWDCVREIVVNLRIIPPDLLPVVLNQQSSWEHLTGRAKAGRPSFNMASVSGQSGYYTDTVARGEMVLALIRVGPCSIPPPQFQPYCLKSAKT